MAEEQETPGPSLTPLRHRLRADNDGDDDDEDAEAAAADGKVLCTYTLPPTAARQPLLNGVQAVSMALDQVALQYLS